MFGSNNTNSQTPNADTSPPAEPPAPDPANPFGADDTPVSLPQARADSSVPTPPSPSPDNAAAAVPASNDDLLDLKQQALQNLQPLVSHLEQSPEEKFKTTMMLIQASDNSTLVKQAYEAANQITDEKIRAQALLDVINEINYFTHPSGETEPTA